MENITLYMTRNLKDIDNFPLPPGYHIRSFEDGDEKHWANITTQTDEFSDETRALDHFNKEFQPNIEETKKRMLILETSKRQPIGTVTAWFGEWEGLEAGRLHWVSIIPAYQGKKLGKPLVSAALAYLAKHHDHAYLTTQAKSFPAINMYEQFGFAPYITSDKERPCWDLVYEKVKRRV